MVSSSATVGQTWNQAGMPGTTRAQHLCHTLVAQCPGTDTPASLPGCAFSLSCCFFSGCRRNAPLLLPDLSDALPLVLTEQCQCSFYSQRAEVLGGLRSGVEAGILLGRPLSSVPSGSLCNAYLFLSSSSQNALWHLNSGSLQIRQRPKDSRKQGHGCVATGNNLILLFFQLGSSSGP